jgi:multiple sugar transport system substrate-binding protein
MKKVGFLFVTILAILAIGSIGAQTVSAWSLKEAAAPYAGATIRVSAMSGYQYNANAVELAKEFEKETGIKVVIDMVTYGEVIEKHMMELSSGTAAHDLYDCDSIYLPQYVPYCVPIDTYMNDPKLMDPDMVMNDFYPQLIEGLSYADKLYTFPQMNTFASLFYRKDLLEKAGIQAPSYNEAWTLDQYYDAAKKLTQDTDGDGKTDIYGATLSGARTGIGDEVYTLFWGSGGSLFDDELKPTFGKGGPDHDKMVKVLTLVQKFYTEGLVPPGATDYEIGEAAGVFEQGLVATSWNWNLCSSWMDAPTAPQHGKIGVSLIPRDDQNAKRWHRQGTKGFLITKNSKNKEAAYLFMQWLSRPDIQLKQIELNDSTPPRISVLEKSEYKDKFTHSPQLRYVSQIKGDRPVPYIPEWSQCEDIMAVPFQQCMVGKISPEEAANEAAMGIESMLKSKRYYKEGKKFRGADGKYPTWLTGNYQ